jgi:tRNA threonylcarbamoyl adenosine modification protein YjeE
MDQALPAVDDFPIQATTEGPQGTAGLGRRAAGLLSGGEIILLYGDLGAGKTCFAQGLCAGLDVSEEVVSPTFTLVNTYVGRLKVHHLDFYRVEPDHDLDDIGLPDILDEVWDGQAVALGSATPRLELLARPGKSPSERTWFLRGVPEVPADWAQLFGGEEVR